MHKRTVAIISSAVRAQPLAGDVSHNPRTFPNRTFGNRRVLKPESSFYPGNHFYKCVTNLSSKCVVTNK